MVCGASSEGGGRASCPSWNLNKGNLTSTYGNATKPFLMFGFWGSQQENGVKAIATTAPTNAIHRAAHGAPACDALKPGLL